MWGLLYSEAVQAWHSCARSTSLSVDDWGGQAPGSDPPSLTAGLSALSPPGHRVSLTLVGNGPAQAQQHGDIPHIQRDPFPASLPNLVTIKPPPSLSSGPDPDFPFLQPHPRRGPLKPPDSPLQQPPAP